MSNLRGSLYICCLGAHCGNLFEAEEKNLSVCEDGGSTFFGIYGLCKKPGCDFENLIREDHFASRDLLIHCPDCAVKTPVASFDWEKLKDHHLTFETACAKCKETVRVTWKG